MVIVSRAPAESLACARLGWLNASLKSMETREELSTSCNPKVMSRCLSAPDATSFTSLTQEQAATTNMASMVRIQVFSIIMHS